MLFWSLIFFPLYPLLPHPSSFISLLRINYARTDPRVRLFNPPSSSPPSTSSLSLSLLSLHRFLRPPLSIYVRQQPPCDHVPRSIGGWIWRRSSSSLWLTVRLEGAAHLLAPRGVQQTQ
jgi:hypothetical protein